MDEPTATVLYEPVLLDPESDNVVYQAGAFTSAEQAQQVLAVWRSEGRIEPMAVNSVVLYGSVDEWNAGR